MTADAHGKFSGKRLVILGCGYVGTAMARKARASGLRVIALTRNEAKAAALRAEGVETVVADLAGDAWHTRIPGEADLVLNCVSSGGGGIEAVRRSYIGGMESLLAWARTRGAPGTIVYTGSTSVYPQGGGVRVDETAPTAGAGERAQSLLEAEARLRSGVGAGGRWFILRLAGIYGPGRHRLLDQVRAGQVAGRGEHQLNLIHRDDIVAAIWAAFAAAPAVAGGIFNVADDSAATRAEIAMWLAGRLGVAVPRFTGEPMPGRTVVTPDRIIANGRIKAQLGWRPAFPGFREGYENILSR